MDRLRVLVVGGGIAGMAFAIAAKQHGHNVDLVELDPRVVGVGIFLTGSTLSALESIGLAEACVEQGLPANSILYMDGAGNELGEKYFPQIASPHLPRAAGIQRRTLARIFAGAAERDGAQISFGRTVNAIDQDETGAVATLCDGSKERYDLIVGADGIYSKVRQLVFGSELAPVHAGQGGWRFMTPRIPEVDRVFLFETDGLKSGIIPLDEDWMYGLLTVRDPDREWIEPGSGPARLHKLLEPFTAPILQELRDRLLVADPVNVMWRPFETLLMDKSWSNGRVVLIGDAVHSMTPHLSSGGGMAIEDAVILAECISTGEPIEEALATFFRQRFDRVQHIQGICMQICLEETSDKPSRDKIFDLTNQGYQALANPFLQAKVELTELAA